MIWSLLKVVLFVAVVAGLTFGASILVDTGGGIRIAAAGYEFTLGPLQAVITLLALMLLTHARRAARIAQGTLVPLEAQDRRLWDTAMIAGGLDLLDRAMTRRAPGPFQIKAAIAALHVQAAPDEGTDWTQIALLYDSLLRMEPTPVIRLNRAVALAEAGALPAAFREIEALAGDLDGYPQFHAARADLLRRLARPSESEAALDRAIALAPTFADAAFLRARRSETVIPQADARLLARNQKKGRASARPKSNREV